MEGEQEPGGSQARPQLTPEGDTSGPSFLTPAPGPLGRRPLDLSSSPIQDTRQALPEEAGLLYHRCLSLRQTLRWACGGWGVVPLPEASRPACFSPLCQPLSLLALVLKVLELLTAPRTLSSSPQASLPGAYCSPAASLPLPARGLAVCCEQGAPCCSPGTASGLSPGPAPLHRPQMTLCAANANTPSRHPSGPDITGLGQARARAGEEQSGPPHPWREGSTCPSAAGPKNSESEGYNFWMRS